MLNQFSRTQLLLGSEAMGAGNKLDPGRFQVTDIYQPEGNPYPGECKLQKAEMEIF